MRPSMVCITSWGDSLADSGSSMACFNAAVGDGEAVVLHGFPWSCCFRENLSGYLYTFWLIGHLFNGSVFEKYL